mgnify:FL=1
MQVYTIDHNALPHLKDSVACIGFFDGFHKGHQALVKACKEEAKKLGLLSAIITFDPDPWVLFHPTRVIEHITPLEDKIELASHMGIDAFYILKFTRDFASLDTSQFHTLLSDLHVKSLVCGFDFRYAIKNEGNTDTLLKQDLFSVHVVDAILDPIEKISSTRIEAALKEGRVFDAAQMLGYGYSIEGMVEHGYHRGTSLLQIPTANLKFSREFIVPFGGVYAGLGYYKGMFYPTMINIGTNPTFKNENMSIEAHLISFHGDLYGQTLRLFFIDRIRPEQRFDGIDALKSQLHHDIDETLSLLQKQKELVENTYRLWG